MKIKASDLEKQWGEDLIRRGVFDPPLKNNWKERLEYFWFCDFYEDIDKFTKELQDFISQVEKSAREEGVKEGIKLGGEEAVRLFKLINQ